MAYKGYFIKTDFLGRISITKDKYHIGWAESIEDAKKKIDILVD